MKNNNKRSNSLFALERELFGNFQQQSHQPAKKKRQQPQKEARAFDFGEAIELPYNSAVFDRGEAIELEYGGDNFSSETPEAVSFSAPNSFASELEDESLPFEVEAFEVDDEVIPVSKPETPQPEIAESETQEETEVQPVKATVVPPSETSSKSARPVKQPTTDEETGDREELSDAQAFAEDIEAILNGEKTYDPEQKQVVSTSPTAPPTAPSAAPTSHPHDIFDKRQAALPPQKLAEPAPMSNSHAVFDQMGKNMAHATDFDQGTVDLTLEQTFDEFDRILVEEDKPPLPKKSEVSEQKAQTESMGSSLNSLITQQYWDKYESSSGRSKNEIDKLRSLFKQFEEACHKVKQLLFEINPIKEQSIMGLWNRFKTVEYSYNLIVKMVEEIQKTDEAHLNKVAPTEESKLQSQNQLKHEADTIFLIKIQETVADLEESISNKLKEPIPLISKL